MNYYNIERRFRKFSISNLTLYVTIGMIIVYFFSLINPAFKSYIDLDAEKIFSGQIWRLVTFIFIPSSVSPIWFFFEVAFFYWVGTSLENVWGSFKFTIYYFGGILGATLAVIISYLLGVTNYIFLYSVSTYFSLSLFLAFAWYYGEQYIRLMLFIPVKVKYIAIFDILLIIYTLINTPTWGGRIVLLSSMLNIITFYAIVLSGRAKNKSRYLSFQMKVNKSNFMGKVKPRHRCVVCGKTEHTDPDMDFRYCSKCEGDYEFCEEHLFNHEHFTKIVDFKKQGD